MRNDDFADRRKRKSSSVTFKNTDEIRYTSSSDISIFPPSSTSLDDEFTTIEDTTKTFKQFQYKAGMLNLISKKYESLDYDKMENDVLVNAEEREGYKYFVHKNIMQWVVFLLTGILTAAIASTVDIAIVEVCKVKYYLLDPYLNDNDIGFNKPLFLWMFLNVIPILIGSLMVTYFEPIASGSGIPLVKCYLNGIDLPRILALKTLFVKATGLVCSIAGGVASGKEGPMIHVGACVANLVSKGRMKFCNREIHMFRYFRDDQERRDFVSAGAASGVSAAFGASVGGVLFSLEEGASFWNQNLTWRIFFGSVVSTFTVNLILSAYYGAAGDLTHPSLINMGKFTFTYQISEIPIFALIGSIGGVFGALWNHSNYKLSVFRFKFFKKKWMKVTEACFVSALTAAISFTMAYFTKQCRPITEGHTIYTPRAFCEDANEYNLIARMWLQTPQASVQRLLHDPADEYPLIDLAIFTLAYFFLSCITFGLSTSNGIFVPSLLTGAAWGRMISTIFIMIFPDYKNRVDTGKYALIGAAAHLGGLVRMTISLTVIIMETSDNISFSLPIIITLISAKWTGDFFNEGIYAIQIRLKKAPFLPFDPPPMTHNIYATEVMNNNVVGFRSVETVDFLYETLEKTEHNGFPVLELENPEDDLKYGKIVGLILRDQILLILKKKWFSHNMHLWAGTVTMNIFRDEYLHKYRIEDIELTFEEKAEYSVDFRPFLNHSPYTLLSTASLPKMFRLFRALGLRHLPIVNDSNEVVGMVTRKDLAKFRVYIKKGRMKLHQYIITED
ncbi:PREDICTED: H(+)/Cl(-) exchange transporter 7-like [Nicrophorus vespilloides]|uniref:Chloride channel protein n=1 Tax=Nicrophorus vespilloides TaxID=110193 RepID=A0ABM1N755_NICVS|nr:PREDICTED: H(+)/Cl(-) exchange transporter 7-like [Nicrophorus vespilloides]